MLDRDALLAKWQGRNHVPITLAIGRSRPVPHARRAQPRTHDLKLLPQNVHWGYYDPSVKPVLRVASGDTFASRR